MNAWRGRISRALALAKCAAARARRMSGDAVWQFFASLILPLGREMARTRQ